MKKVYLVHGWGGNSDTKLFNWIKEELKEKVDVYAFDMPDTENPKINAWVNFLEENVKEIDNETYFVGHSIGCQTILRFLEKLDVEVKIAGCVFVAGWFNLQDDLSDEEKKIAKSWIETPIDIEKVKKHCDNFLALFSTNDPYVPLSDRELFKARLNAKTITKESKGHFDDVTKIEEVLEFITR